MRPNITRLALVAGRPPLLALIVILTTQCLFPDGRCAFDVRLFVLQPLNLFRFRDSRPIGRCALLEDSLSGPELITPSKELTLTEVWSYRHKSQEQAL